MNSQNKTVSSFSWVLVSVGGFIIFIGVAFFFIFFSDKINNIKLPVYFFLLVIVALIAAAFLSGALKSHAKYSGKVYNGTLEMGGPVVVFALIIYMGYIFRPVQSYTNLKVTVFADETNSSLINAGMVKLLLNKPDSQQIINGLAEFTDVPAEFAGKEVTIIPEVDGYYTNAQQVKINTENVPVQVHLLKKPDSVSISGIVINQSGKAVSNAIIIFEDGFAKDTTDAYGNFRLKLPFKEGHESRIRIYTNSTMRYNNEQVLSSQGSMILQIH